MEREQALDTFCATVMFIGIIVFMYCMMLMFGDEPDHPHGLETHTHERSE